MSKDVRNNVIEEAYEGYEWSKHVDHTVPENVSEKNPDEYLTSDYSGQVEYYDWTLPVRVSHGCQDMASDRGDQKGHGWSW